MARRPVRKGRSRLGKIGQAQVEEVWMALMRGARKIENTAVEKIVSPPKTGRIYPSRGRKGAKHQASAPGEPPAADTGETHGSITSADKSELGVLRTETAANVPHAVALEHGSSKMKPRPFMGPSYDENILSIRVDIVRAMKRGARRGHGGG